MYCASVETQTSDVLAQAVACMTVNEGGKAASTSEVHVAREDINGG